MSMFARFRPPEAAVPTPMPAMAPTLPDVIDYLERVAMIEHGDGVPQAEVEDRAAQCFGFVDAGQIKVAFVSAFSSKPSRALADSYEPEPA